MILGLSLSHDASAAITDDQGLVQAALGEERISRVKNYDGIPEEAIRKLINCSEKTNSIEKVIIGSHESMSRGTAVRMLAPLELNPSNPKGKGFQLRPGLRLEQVDLHLTPRNLIENAIRKILFEFSIVPKEFIWENHHYSHLGCALGATEYDRNLLLSFDGHGDGESAAIAVGGRRKIEKKLTSISQLDSLGTLYSAVTLKYNFKPNQHEGKITGLAAFGSYSRAADFLLKNVKVSNGKVELNYFKNKIASTLIGGIRALGFKTNLKKSMEDIISMAELKTNNYEDLAFAIQFVLENSILEMADYWIKKTGIANLSLAGGVFSNVKLNQRLADLSIVNSVNVFPNMGDGGIALGAIWRHLSKTNELSFDKLYEDMFLGPVGSTDTYFNDANLNIEMLSSDEIARRAAKDISIGKLVAVHQSKMEFGPRALGNRSLLLDPRNARIQQTANQRLMRTEFMPFAPMVLEKEFNNFFTTNNGTLSPFYFMTMTCNVRGEKRSLIPAVTHVDGTARPQIINEKTNKLCSNILEEFNKLTNIPVVVNTSLNVHEEPINYGINDTIKCLKRGVIDVIYTESSCIKLKS